MKKKNPPKIKSKKISRFRRLGGKRTKKIYQKSIPKRLKKKFTFHHFLFLLFKGVCVGRGNIPKKKYLKTPKNQYTI
jgi:hypothetical protein